MKKIIITSTFPVSPPQSGGQVRIYNLYKYFNSDYKINILSISSSPNNKKDIDLINGLHEKTILLTNFHNRLEYRVYKHICVPVTDTVMPLFSRFTPDFRMALKNYKDSNFLISNHPYFIYELLRIRKNQKLIYESCNVEYLLKKQMYPKNIWSRLLLGLVYRTEKACCRKSDLIICVSNEDKVLMAKLYNVDKDKIHVIPNGVDCGEVTMRTKEDMLKAIKKMEIKRKFALFIGSAHLPNIDAAKILIKIAAKMPKYDFYLVGSLCNEFDKSKLPENVKLEGVVNDTRKLDLLKAASIALNPMSSGSGSNLKMAEYMAAGVPCLTTPVGARGYNLVDGKQALIVDLKNFKISIGQLIENEELQTKLAKEARSYIEKNFNWEVLAVKYQNLIENMGDN